MYCVLSHQRKVASPLRLVAAQVKVASSPAVRVGGGARTTEEGGSGGGGVGGGGGGAVVVEWWSGGVTHRQCRG